MIFRSVEVAKSFFRGRYDQNIRNYGEPSFEGYSYVTYKPEKKSMAFTFSDLFGHRRKLDDVHIMRFISRVEEALKENPAQKFYLPATIQYCCPNKPDLEEVYKIMDMIKPQLKKICLSVNNYRFVQLVDANSYKTNVNVIFELEFPASFRDFFKITDSEIEVQKVYYKELLVLSEKIENVFIAALLLNDLPSLYKMDVRHKRQYLIPTFVEKNNLQLIEAVLSAEGTNRDAFLAAFCRSEEAKSRMVRFSCTACGIMPNSMSLNTLNRIKEEIDRAMSILEEFKSMAERIEAIIAFNKENKIKNQNFIKAIAAYINKNYIDFQGYDTNLWKKLEGVFHGRVEDFDIEESEAEEATDV